MTWMFFLKGYDTQEETWEYKAYKEKKEYNSITQTSVSYCHFLDFTDYDKERTSLLRSSLVW